jgi:hypothetical protein
MTWSVLIQYELVFVVLGENHQSIFGSLACEFTGTHVTLLPIWMPASSETGL